MTDYYYQAVERDDRPDDEAEPLAEDGRESPRNVYPPEDEAYWAEAGGAAGTVEEPLWYEDRVDRGDAPPSASERPPAPPQERAPTRRGFFRWGKSGAAESRDEAGDRDIAAEDASPLPTEPPAGTKPHRFFRRAKTDAAESRDDARDRDIAAEDASPSPTEPPAGTKLRRIFRRGKTDAAESPDDVGDRDIAAEDASPSPTEPSAGTKLRGLFRRRKTDVAESPDDVGDRDIAAEDASPSPTERPAGTKLRGFFRRGKTDAAESRQAVPPDDLAIDEPPPPPFRSEPEPPAETPPRRVFRWSTSSVEHDPEEAARPDATAEDAPFAPEPPPAQTSRRVFRWAAPTVAEDAEDERQRNAYWLTRDPGRQEEPDAYPAIDDVPRGAGDATAYDTADSGNADAYDAGYDAPGDGAPAYARDWQADAPEADTDRRVYQPGASAAAGAAAAAAAAEAGQHRIRFNPTKERGVAYYDHAARHTRRVRFLRIALPATAVAAVVLFFAVMQFGVDTSSAIINLSGINSDARSVTMDKPHITGFDGTKRAYEVNAVKAVQDLDNPKVMVFEQVKARFGMGNGVKATVDADTGTYDSTSSKLTLKGDILLVTDNGYQAKLQVADIDVDKGTVLSSEPVEINGQQGTLNADTLELLDSGKHVFFRGNVKVIYYPPDKKDGDGSKKSDGTDAAAPADGAAAAAEAAPTTGGAAPAVTAKPSDGTVPASDAPAAAKAPEARSGAVVPAAAPEKTGGST